ncbi:putative c6 finger domain [Phaeomoniella chlamydospora]|uniref:Putative c6 finger domain n=1 Tax=Phaeomoniella chlamydospora TaxID=158046 RepID=A0A0G2EJM9_PHACM|nr:putative c6 finger domain [Phaeomoniella chlamydospora]
MVREPLNLSSTSLKLDLSNVSALVEAYFERVNIWYACVNPNTWSAYYREALSRGFQDGPESCAVLLILALGSAALAGSISYNPPDRESPGLTFFAAAWALIPGLMVRNSVISAQCTILSSAYLFYLVRPLEAWTLLSNTNTRLQLLLGSPGRIPPYAKELSDRVYWNSFLFESDLLAELDLPHSGIVQFEEFIDLPHGWEEDEEGGTNHRNSDSESSTPPPGRDSLWYFLAEINLRRLLNRVSHLIYQKSHPLTSLLSLDPITSELDFQLTQWYESLPLPVRFPRPDPCTPYAPLRSAIQTVLRLRYYACRTIIFRPYILAVLENESLLLPSSPIRENCFKCLDASIHQLQNISEHHAGHLPYLWQGALSMVSQTLLVMGATMSTGLRELLPCSLTDVEMIVVGVRDEVVRYKDLAPSLKLSAEILVEAEGRWRLWWGLREREREREQGEG